MDFQITNFGSFINGADFRLESRTISSLEGLMGRGILITTSDFSEYDAFGQLAARPALLQRLVDLEANLQVFSADIDSVLQNTSLKLMFYQARPVIATATTTLHHLEKGLVRLLGEEVDAKKPEVVIQPSQNLWADIKSLAPGDFSQADLSSLSNLELREADAEFRLRQLLGSDPNSKLAEAEKFKAAHPDHLNIELLYKFYLSEVSPSERGKILMHLKLCAACHRLNEKMALSFAFNKLVLDHLYFKRDDKAELCKAILDSDPDEAAWLAVLFGLEKEVWPEQISTRASLIGFDRRIFDARYKKHLGD